VLHLVLLISQALAQVVDLHHVQLNSSIAHHPAPFLHSSVLDDAAVGRIGLSEPSK